MTPTRSRRSAISTTRSGSLAFLFALIAAGATMVNVAWAGAPPEAEVQGLYEGTGRNAAGEFRIESRVVAQGKGIYKVFVRQFLAADAIARVELAGKTAADAVSFEGKAGDLVWKGVYAAGTIKGECGQGGTFEIKRVEKKSPTVGKKPPAGAIVLLDGKNFVEMVRANGADWYLGDMSMHGWPVWEVPLWTIAQKEPPEWPSKDQMLPKGWFLGKQRRRGDIVTGIGEDGSIQIPRDGMNSQREFDGSFELHVEFMIPFMPTEHSQGRGNSGVYLPNGEEIQVLDSFGDVTYRGGGCGGLYNYKDPDTMEVIESLKDKQERAFTLASLPPLAWQTYDILYRVEKKDGKYAGKPRVTVFHNGIKIHDNVAPRNDARKGRLHFQDHGNPVRYRNIWVVPAAEQ